MNTIGTAEQMSKIDDTITESLTQLEPLLQNREYSKFISLYTELYEDLEDTVCNSINEISEGLVEEPLHRGAIAMINDLDNQVLIFKECIAALLEDYCNQK